MTISDVSEDDALATLVAQAQAGDGAAMETLVAQLRPRVFRYVLARMLDPHTADDVTQEVAMTVLAALPRYVDQGRPVTAWVFGIAANKLREQRRASSRRQETSVDMVGDRIGDESLEPEQATLRLDAARRMAALLATLPDQQAEVLRLRIAAGLSAEETAAVLDMTAGAVRVAQHRALARLRSTHALDAFS
jgi:RNA polymerase sigma-70 factor, ECF subfamily